MAKIFFSGIGGSGVSALASFAADGGAIVSGSDRSFDRNPHHPIAAILRAKGITLVPQDGSGIDGSFDCAVFSTAVEETQPEVLKARALGIPVKTRPEYLNETVRPYRAVAVAGTSGKSTTAGMLAFLMDRLGMKPNFIGGGRVKQFKDERNVGNAITGSSDLLVFEACESDGTIVSFSPSATIITNLALDHHPVAKTAAMFEALAQRTKGMVIVNADDRHLMRCRFDRAVTFSLYSDAAFRAESIACYPYGTDFWVRSVRFHVALPGMCNVYNALACLAILSSLGISLDAISAVLPDFRGIERRFDVHLCTDRYLVIDDYAHNPHKIASLMETVAKMRERVCYVFQPHGYGPTRFMKHAYVEAFVSHLRPDDSLLLLPIFYAGGTSIKDVSSDDLCREIRSSGKRAEVLAERSLLYARLAEWDSYVVLGARDDSLSDFAREIAKRLRTNGPGDEEIHPS